MCLDIVIKPRICVDSHYLIQVVVLLSINLLTTTDEVVCSFLCVTGILTQLIKTSGFNKEHFLPQNWLFFQGHSNGSLVSSASLEGASFSRLLQRYPHAWGLVSSSLAHSCIQQWNVRPPSISPSQRLKAAPRQRKQPPFQIMSDAIENGGVTSTSM